MATASAAGPGGFSYAQAARGRQQAAAAAAAATSEMASTKDWAEDVEASVRTKEQESVVESQDTLKSAESKASMTERLKVESKVPSSPSGVSSPDIAASATSHDDVSSSAQNGSSLSSWEAKSQSSDTVVPSEPAWIIERKERQSTQKSDLAPKNGNTTIVTEQKPVVLHDAPPPTVNPWAKRAEEAKVKQPSPPAPKPTHAPTQAPTAPPPNSRVETQSNARSLDSSQPRSRKAENKTSTSQPPPVKDEISWPTPETSQETEKKTSTSHQTHDDDDSAAGKPRKKQEWKPVPVVPNIIWETPGVRERTSRPSPNGDRAPRGGASIRGRGGSRGAANTAHNDRSSPTSEATSAGTARISRADADAPRSEESKPQKASRKPEAGLAAETMTNGHLPADGSLTSQTQLDATDGETKLSDDKQDAPIINGVNGTNGAISIRTHMPEFTPASESRKEGRNSDSKEQWPTSRGSARRGGRGRGGNRELVNGHAYALTSPHDILQLAPQLATRGGHQSPYNLFGRAGSRISGTRTHSFPDAYSRYPGHFMGPQSFAMQAFAPVFDYNQFQMPTPPTPGHADPLQVASTVTSQVDYYFSVNNLTNDTYLRKNMDSQGYVFLEVIAAFNRLRHITTDYELLKFACLNSQVVEICVGDDGKERLRKASGWEKYVLPLEERFAAACKEGPQHVESISRNNFFASQHLRQHTPFMMAPAPASADSRSYDASFIPTQLSPQAMFFPEYVGLSNGHSNGDEDARGRHTTALSHDMGDGLGYQSTSSTANEDPDIFPNHKFKQLTVCVMLSGDKESVPQYNAASRTFSNGSIDTKVAETDETKFAADDAKSPESKNDDSSTQALAAPTPSTKDFSVFWIKDNDNPVGSLPSNLTPEPYYHLRNKAYKQRTQAAIGTCPYDLDVLYQFWSHFLIRNFNNTMYSEFVHYAHEDAAVRDSMVGHRNLLKFYDEAIKSINLIPLRVAKDYAALIKVEAKKEASSVFESLHRAWRDGTLNVLNRKRITENLDTRVIQLLQSVGSMSSPVE